MKNVIFQENQTSEEMKTHIKGEGCKRSDPLLVKEDSIKSSRNK